MKKNGHTWKWPRNYYGFLVDYLKAAGARTIVFDVIFADPDIDRLHAQTLGIAQMDQIPVGSWAFPLH